MNENALSANLSDPGSGSTDPGPQTAPRSTQDPARGILDVEPTPSRIVWPELADAIRNGTFRAWLLDEEITHWFHTGRNAVAG